MSTISRVWPTALKLGCITNFDMLFLVMRFISLVDEIQFMLISSRHICIRSIANQDKTMVGNEGRDLMKRRLKLKTKTTKKGMRQNPNQPSP